jgi:hypothetical protein
VATETGTYSCQQARVRAIEVRKEEKRAKVMLRVLPSLVTEQRRKDMDVTVSVVSDSKEIRTKSWESLTVGADDSTANKLGFFTVAAAMASTSKTPEADFEFTTQEFAALFGPDRAPSVRPTAAPRSAAADRRGGAGSRAPRRAATDARRGSAARGSSRM